MVQRMVRIKIVLISFLIINLIFCAIAVYQQQVLKIPNRSRIIAWNIEVFQDPNCTQYLEIIDWGNITINSTYTKTAYLKNSGNIPLLLSMNTSDYNPPQSEFVFNLTWNLEEEIINPLVVKECNFTLTTGLEHYYISNFTFNIYIYGKEF